MGRLLHHPQAVGGHPVTGDDDAAAGGDVAELATDGVTDHNLRCREFGWHRVPVAAIGHQCLARGRPGFCEDHRIRHRRQGLQRFGLGDHGDRGAAIGGGPDAGVATNAGEAVNTDLSRFDGEFVGQGAPPTLRGSVIDLLHHTLAVAPPRRADRHRDPVVLGHPGERGGDPPRRGIADGGHPVEPPHP